MNFTSGEALSLKRDPIPGDDRSGWKETYHLDVMATDGYYSLRSLIENVLSN
jgi:hypothetical protein